MNSILSKWRSQIHSSETGFVNDGILNHEKYELAKPKLCFLCKEANYKGKNDISIMEWYNDGGFGHFSNRISQWAAGIHHDFPPIEDLNQEQLMEALHRSAVVNIKKTGGGGKADDGNIMQHAIQYRELLHEQLSEIAPHIIVMGLSVPSVRNAAFPELKWKSSGYYCDVAIWKNIKLIDFYHPSSRNAPSASYSLLQNIINSEAFKQMGNDASS